MEIKKVCVVGAGLMGRQIGLNTALYDYEVYLTDNSPEALVQVAQWLDEYLKGRLAKGKLTQEAVDAAKARFHIVETLEEAAKDADLVIEAIIEVVDIKKEFFKKLDAIVREDTIIATNSSRMVSSMFKDCVRNPSRLANLHYFNPALVMKLTEIVQGEHTSLETIETLIDFSKKTNKNPIWLRKEIDGFVANRILRALQVEALYLQEQGICSLEEIDTAVEDGLGHPMGPFRLMDLTGIDLSYLQRQRILDETGEKPIGYDLLKEKYDKREWGRKTGKGWYDYSAKK